VRISRMSSGWLAGLNPGPPKFVTRLLLDVRINLELLCFGPLHLVSLEVKANSEIRGCVNKILCLLILFEAVQPHDRLLFGLTGPKHNRLCYLWIPQIK